MLKPEQVLDSVGTNVTGDILISSETMLEALSEFTGRKIVQFTDEPTMNAWWLLTDKGEGEK